MRAFGAGSFLFIPGDVPGGTGAGRVWLDVTRGAAGGAFPAEVEGGETVPQRKAAVAVASLADGVQTGSRVPCSPARCPGGWVTGQDAGRGLSALCGAGRSSGNT